VCGRRREADTELKTKTPHVNVGNYDKLMHCWKYAQIDPDMGITVGIHHPGSRYFQIESSRIFSGTWF